MTITILFFTIIIRFPRVLHPQQRNLVTGILRKDRDELGGMARSVDCDFQLAQITHLKACPEGCWDLAHPECVFEIMQ